MIGRLYTDCSFVKGRPVPALQPGKGNDYLELEKLPSDEFLEVIGMSFRAKYIFPPMSQHTFIAYLVTYLLVTTLRERLYSVTKYVYGQRRRPLANLRLQASRSFANLRDNLRRTITPSSSQH